MKMTRGIVAALLLAVAAGCGSGDEEPGVASAGGDRPAGVTTPVAPDDREAALRDFAQCMRDNGVDLPDPQPGNRVAGEFGRLLRDGDPVVREAMVACRSRLPNGGEPPRLNQEQLEIYRAFAACMRDNGVEVPDPAPDGSLRGALVGQVDPDDPDFQAALEACRDHLAGLAPGAGQ